MANKDKQGKKDKKDKAAQVPVKKVSVLKRKPCKSPRGLKLEKAKDQLLDKADTPIRRHRNQYNERMAQVKRLANLVMRIG